MKNYMKSSIKVFKLSERRHSLLQGQLEYVMHTFELTSQKVTISLRFPKQKKACSRSRLINFPFLFAPAI